MGKGKPRHTPSQPTPPQRLFTNEFRVGERVSIIRHRHGWEDGRITGIIKSMGPTSATVLGDPDDYDLRSEYLIEHCRDINSLEPKNKSYHPKKA